LNFRFQRQPSLYTTEAVRSPATAVHLVRCINLLTIQFNELTQKTLFFVNYIIITCTVLSNFVLIRYHSSMGLPVLIITLGGSGGGAAFTFFSHIKFGEVHEASKKFIASSKRNFGEFPKPDRQLLQKYSATHRALKVKLSSTGYYHKPNTLRVLGKIVLYTTKFLLVTRNRM